MHIIGITGGVGAGKTTVLNYIKENYPCTVLMADEIGRQVQKRGQEAYPALVDLLGESVLDEERELNRGKMAETIFRDGNIRRKAEDIIHPAVKARILKELENATKREEKFVFIEAALLIEAGYLDILDELWYIKTKDCFRKERLLNSRGYTYDKTEKIMKSQLTDEAFGSKATKVIHNDLSLANTFHQIDQLMGEYI